MLISTVVVFPLWLNFGHLGPTKHARVKGTLALGATLLSLSLTLVNPFLFGFNAARFLGGQFESVWTLLNWTLTFPFVTRLACPLLQFHVGAIWGLVALGWSALECKTAPSSLVSVHRPPRLSVFKLVLFPVSAKVHFGWVCSFRRRRRRGWSNALHRVCVHQRVGPYTGQWPQRRPQYTGNSPSTTMALASLQLPSLPAVASTVHAMLLSVGTVCR